MLDTPSIFSSLATLGTHKTDIRYQKTIPRGFTLRKNYITKTLYRKFIVLCTLYIYFKIVYFKKEAGQV